MKKYCYAGLMLLAIVLFPVPDLNAQGENDQLWYCWEETVKPDKVDEYLALSKEVIELCKKENYPFRFFTWSRSFGVYEWWGPIDNLGEINRIEEEWTRILKIWGEEKVKAYTETKLKHYSKTCTLMGDLAYFPANRDPNEPLTYGRWIELYLKPGKMSECISLIKKLNEHRASFGIQDNVQFGWGGLGYQSPSMLAFYLDSSKEEYERNFDSTPEAYQEHFQEYLDEMFKLLLQLPQIYDYNHLTELSYAPGQ